MSSFRTLSEARRPESRSRRAARIVAIAATSAMGLGMLGAPVAFAAAPTGGTTGSKPALTPLQQGIVDARAKAKSTGKPVVVDAMTTETSLTLINPDGIATTTDNAHPVRTKRDKGWADLDATLRKNADGTLSPVVSSLGVTLSGGGNGPMATVTTTDGKKLAVTAPFALPAPTLDGANATYPNVLPDVDLKVTVLPTGGWRDVIVVKTAQAAADPRLKTLHFPISADGLNVATDEAGNISLKDASGKTRLHAPTPLQWDSTPPAPPSPVAPGATTAKATSAFALPNTATQPKTEASTTEGPGDGAHESRITVKADSHGFDLTPDPATFGKGTGPWYLDPYISADSGTANSAQVQEYHPDTTYYNAVSDLGTGYCGYSDCTGYGRERAYFTININSAIYTQPGGAPSAPTVYNSTLFANADGASSPGTNTPLGLYWTGPIGSGTTWNNQPCNGGGTFGGCGKVGNSYWLTGTGTINFDVSSQMQQAASQKWGNWTVGIAPDDENNKYYRHHIANNPHITTNYDLQPSIWWPHTTPQPGFANDGDGRGSAWNFDCNSGGANPWTNVGWIGANQNITLTTSSWSPAGLNLHTTFHMWDDNNSSWSLTPDSGWTGSYNGNNVTVSVGSLTDGHQYGWDAHAFDFASPDTGLTSPDTSWCYFRVDKTPPTVSVTSAQFPPSGSPAPSTLTYANQPGTFTITGTDPLPPKGANDTNNPVASGVACFKVSTSSTPVTGWKCGDSQTANSGVLLPDGNGQANYTYTPGTWGTNTLYVQAQDNAGNYSQPYAYNFYAPWNPASAAVYGDLTGDGKPDITLPDGTGNLRLIQNTGDPTNAGWVSALGITAPGGAGWNGLQITHRATLRTPVFPSDDLIVHKPGDAMMYLYTNKGQGTYNAAVPFYPSGSATPTQVSCVDTANQPVAPGNPGNCPTGVGLNFSNVTQILALGNPDNEITTAPLSRTTLLCVINGQLWMMPPGGAATLLKKTDTQLSAAPWDGSNNTDGYDLIGPGPANGPTSWTDTSNTVHTVKQATLWARDRKTGQILSFAITKNADGTTSFANLADPTKVYSSTSPGATVIGGGVDTTTYPVVGSVGDFTGDGIADLYAQNAAGQIIVWPGVVGDPTGHPGVVTGFGTPFTVGDPRAPLGRYQLNGNANDLTGQHNGTVTGDVTFGSTTIGGVPTTAATFNSTSNNGEVNSGLQVNTQQSFTVTAWAREDQSTDGVVVSQDGASTSNFMIWPGTFQAGVTTWTFGMSTSDSGWSYDHTNPVNSAATMNAAARVQLGAWTKLTASYDATTGQMALYVNGALAATGLHTSTMAPTGTLAIGRYLNAGAKNNFFKGAIADVAVYPFATVPGSTAGPLVSNVNTSKCLDESGGSSTSGTKVQIWDCNGTAAQQWTANTNGTITLPNGLCLDDTNMATGNGTPVQAATCWGDAQSNKAQQWIPRADGSILNTNSQRCLADPASNITNGTQLILWDCDGGPEQKWTLTPNKA